MSTTQVDRELDVLVAERVMGLDVYRHDGGDDLVFTEDRDWADAGEPLIDTGGNPRKVPRYSTDIAAAFQVVEAILKRFRRFEIHALPDCYAVQVEDGTDDINSYYVANVEAETAPLAICRAALAALGVELPVEQPLPDPPEVRRG